MIHEKVDKTSPLNTKYSYVWEGPRAYMMRNLEKIFFDDNSKIYLKKLEILKNKSIYTIKNNYAFDHNEFDNNLRKMKITSDDFLKNVLNCEEEVKKAKKNIAHLLETNYNRLLENPGDSQHDLLEKKLEIVQHRAKDHLLFYNLWDQSLQGVRGIIQDLSNKINLTLSYGKGEKPDEPWKSEKINFNYHSPEKIIKELNLIGEKINEIREELCLDFDSPEEP